MRVSNMRGLVRSVFAFWVSHGVAVLLTVRLKSTLSGIGIVLAC